MGNRVSDLQGSREQARRSHVQLVCLISALAGIHELTLSDSTRLAEILRHRAALLEHIITDQRYYSDYFRVAFYGTFPDAIRNKQFIVRSVFPFVCTALTHVGLFAYSTVATSGRSLVRSANGCSTSIRVRNSSRRWATPLWTFASATISISNAPLLPRNPAATYPSSPTPTYPLKFGRTTNTGMLFNYRYVLSRSHRPCSDINLFSYSRPISKMAPDGTEEVWVEKTYLTTEQYFPTVLRRSEVVHVQVHSISPVETALLEVEQRTRELAGLNQKYSSLAKTAQHVSTNVLAMSLNAAVDAPLNSGVGAFRQVFLSDDYADRFQDRVEQVEKLRVAIDEQVCGLCHPDYDSYLMFSSLRFV